MTPEREREIRARALLAAACAAEAVGGPLDTIERDRADLLAEVDRLREAIVLPPRTPGEPLPCPVCVGAARILPRLLCDEHRAQWLTGLAQGVR